VVGVFIFGSVRFLSKIVTKPNFFLKKSKPIQTDRFQFGSVMFFRTKTGSNRFWLGLTRFFPVWLDFFDLAQFWLGCFPVFSVQARFGSVFSVLSLKNQN
jgi:hypothetical protein